MSERLPDHDRLNIVSMARDIMLHRGAEVFRAENKTLAEATWAGKDPEGDLWFVQLVSSSLYAGDYFSVNLRSAATSDSKRYRFNTANNAFTYENPFGTAVEIDEAIAAENMRSWLLCHPLLENITYDADGTEAQRLREFDTIGAQTAVGVLLDTPEGSALFTQLVATHDPTKTAELHEAFYALSQRPKSFSIGRIATHRALETLVKAKRPKQLPAGPSEIPTV